MPTKITKSTPKSPASTLKPAAKPKPDAKVKATPLAAGNKKTAVEASAAAHPLEGKPAPAFSLTAQNGATLSLKDLTAKGNLVLYFYPKDLTPGCTTQACDFRDHQAELRKAGAEVVGVSGDSASLHDRFIAKHELNFPAAQRSGQRGLQGLWRLRQKITLWPRVHGHRAHHLHHRSQGHHPPRLPQG